MQVRTFEAATFERAQAAVRDALGRDALILGIEETATGVRIMAAIEGADDIASLLAPVVAEPDPALTALLAFHGTPPTIRDALATAAAGQPLEQGLTHALGRRLKAAGLPSRQLLVGPPGHGKSLQAARLARALSAQGEPPRVIAFAERRTPPDAKLAFWLQDSGLGVETLTDEAELARAAREPGPLIVDTQGFSPFCKHGVTRLGALHRLVGDVQSTLVLSIEGQPAALLEMTACFVSLGCRTVLPTKLDLTTRYGGLLTLAASGLAMTSASVSDRLDEPLATLRPEGLARLLAHRFRNRGTPSHTLEKEDAS